MNTPLHRFTNTFFFSFEKDLAVSIFFFHSGNAEDDNTNLMAQTTCPVKESPNFEFEKSHGAEASKNEAGLSDISPSPKDAKVEFDAKNDGNTTDTAGTESMLSEEDIENLSESDSDDGGEGGQKVLWLTFVAQ